MEDSRRNLEMVEGRVMLNLDFLKGIEGLDISEGEPMAYHTSFHIGGPADYFVIPNSIDALKVLVKRLYDEGIRPFVFGAGTNLLVGDNGIRGIVINTLGIKSDELMTNDVINLLGGTPMIGKIRELSEKGIRCLQWAYGIPGTVGGAVYMNAGAFGSDISKWLFDVEVISPQGDLRKIDRRDLQLEYRRSDVSKHGIVVSASFRYEKDDPQVLLKEIDEFGKIRESRHPLNYPNAGSIFKNTSKEISAGKLIEEAGLKGLSVGDAIVSKKHANFIVNLGQARAIDVLELIRRVQDKVLHKFNVFLEPEITIAGE
jgi:UDP-N-acetylmuramate dehydrogenase